MQGENDLAGLGIYIYHNLVEQSSKDAFLQTNIRLRTAPYGF
jgi:hypothetical protein